MAEVLNIWGMGQSPALLVPVRFRLTPSSTRQKTGSRPETPCGTVSVRNKLHLRVECQWESLCISLKNIISLWFHSAGLGFFVKNQIYGLWVRQSNPIQPSAQAQVSGATQVPLLAQTYMPCLTLCHSTAATCRSCVHFQGCVRPCTLSLSVYALHECRGSAV